MNVKNSTLKAVLMTCLIFFIVMGFLVGFFMNRIDSIQKDTKEYVNRIIATRDIMPREIISETDVTMVQVQDIVNVDGLAYRLENGSRIFESVAKNKELSDKLSSKLTDEQIEEVKKQYPIPTDDCWVIGKIAARKIYKGEMINANDLRLAEQVNDKRIYSIPLDSLATGGYNVDVGDKVDICLLYNNDPKSIREYQDLETNKVIDIVLAKKEIVDIRDESGNSKKNKETATVVPGYVCFELTYDEINKVELAKKQGNVFVGIAETYLSDPYTETFMEGATFPKF